MNTRFTCINCITAVSLYALCLFAVWRPGIELCGTRRVDHKGLTWSSLHHFQTKPSKEGGALEEQETGRWIRSGVCKLRARVCLWACTYDGCLVFSAELCRQSQPAILPHIELHDKQLRAPEGCGHWHLSCHRWALLCCARTHTHIHVHISMCQCTSLLNSIATG